MNAESVKGEWDATQGTGRVTYTWPIVISVETDAVGVEGERIDGPWIVISGRRPYR